MTPTTKNAEEDLVVHYPCKYVPVELLAGFGAGCWPCTYEAESFDHADELAHPNLCGNIAADGEYSAQ